MAVYNPPGRYSQDRRLRGDTRKGQAVVVPKAGNPLRSKLRVELSLKG